MNALTVATGWPGTGFPGSGAGAAVSLTVGELTLAVRSEDPALRLTPGSGRRFDEGRAPDVTLHARFDDLSRFRPGPCLFDTHGSWRLTQEDDVLSFACVASHLGGRPYKVARLRPGGDSGELLLDRAAHGGDAVEPLQFPLAELLFIDLLARRRGVLLHACGVVSRGKGVVFAGHSQDGKTTTAHLWHGRPGARVVSDDRIVVRPEGEGFRIHGTPWHGDGVFAEPESAPLTAIFLLEKARANAMREVPRAEAVSRLVARAFPPFYAADAMEKTLAFLEDVTARVPCFALPFRPEPAAAALVERWLEAWS